MNYVLVEFPEDTIHFESNGIGYPCFNSKDNGARYVPEEEYVKHFRCKPRIDTCFKPVRWPESQQYMGDEENPIDALCEPVIADEKTLADFGSLAVWVPLCLIK
jgi:hypothetical protein